MSLRHAIQGECPLCLQKLKDAHPLIQLWFPRIKAQFPDVHCSWTYRGKADQEAAFRDGRSRVRWPDSPHNTMDKVGRPCSRAFDLFQIRVVDKVASWDRGYFKQINDWLTKEQAPFDWGGAWLKFPDAPHWQLKKAEK